MRSVRDWAGADVLDIGCGNGAVTKQIAEQLPAAIDVVSVGGVETAGEINDLVRFSTKFYRNITDDDITEGVHARDHADVDAARVLAVIHDSGARNVAEMRMTGENAPVYSEFWHDLVRRAWPERLGSPPRWGPRPGGDGLASRAGAGPGRRRAR